MRRLLLIVLAACGGGGGDDTSNGDASSGEPGLVKLTITEAGLPKPGIRVYFQNADSSLVTAMATDVDGVASTVMEPGGFVTAIDPLPLPKGEGPFAAPTLIRTFAGVKAGDELVISERFQPAPFITMTLRTNEDPAAVRYNLYACAGVRSLVNPTSQGNGPIVATVSFPLCGASADLTLHAIADPPSLVSVIRKTVTLVHGGTIDLTADTYVPPEDVSYDYTGLPSSIQSLALITALVTDAGQQDDMRRPATVVNGSANVATKRPVIANASQVTDTRLAAAVGTHGVLEWGPSTTSYALSPGSLLLRGLTAEPTYDPATTSVRWTLDVTGNEPNLIVASTTFQVPDPDPTQLIPTFQWEIMATGDVSTQQVRYPTLPAPDNNFDLASPSHPRLLLANVADGDAARANLFVHPGPGRYDGFMDVNGVLVGTAGQIAYETSW